MNQFVALPSPVLALPALIASADDRAQLRFLEFFAANIRNPNTRRAYARAISEFLGWCSLHGVASIAAVQPLHVAGYIEELGQVRSAPTVKQRLAAVRGGAHSRLASRLKEPFGIDAGIPERPASQARRSRTKRRQVESYRHNNASDFFVALRRS